MTIKLLYSSAIIALLLTSISAPSTLAQGDTLRTSFSTPPEATRPYMYWYWLNNNVSAKGITADLQAMKAAGIGEAFIGHIVSEGLPEGSVPTLSPSWWQLVEHALAEGDRIGVRVGMFNGPGWSQSGGPWIKPEQSMRYLISAETRVPGGTSYNAPPPKNTNALQDVALIAYPLPQAAEKSASPLKVFSTPEVEGLAALITEHDKKPVKLAPAMPLVVDITFAEAATLQSLILDFGNSPLRLQGILESVQNGKTTKLRELSIFRTNLSTSMGPLVADPFVFAFAPTITRHVRLTITRLEREPELKALTLSGAARIEYAAEKQLGRMYPEPVPPPDAFLWPLQAEPLPTSVVDIKQVIDLTKYVDKNGVLKWRAPVGNNWIISRISMASTGVMCGPTPPQARGLECDKMSRAAVTAHFDGMIGEFIRRVPADKRKGFQHITLDSYEVGPQNWTDTMTETFKATYGYDPRPWLACLGGQVVTSREQSDRFLWDWRRLVADLIARNYVGGLKAAANRHGLKTWLENYGHWGFPGESLQYGGASDDIGGEYWLWSSLGDVECRLATSCANIYGKQQVSAEAFTSNRNFVQTPANMKTRGDWCMTEGVNHFVLHLYTHQPYDVPPGLVPWFGTDFNRFSTWFKEYGRGWTDYLRRCCYLLQQGNHTADVAYFFGEDTPCMNGQKTPPLPTGYDYDFINAEVLLTRATCKKGRIQLPHGQSYSILVLPPNQTMTPRLLAKLERFVQQGLTLVGEPPQRSPSLAHYPDCDRQVRKISARMWGDAPEAIMQRKVGKGMIFRGHQLKDVMAAMQLPPDVACLPEQVLWTHRGNGEVDIYFISNQSDAALQLAPEFRVTNRQPEIWDAMRDTTHDTALFEILPHATRVPLYLEPAGSCFVIFRKPCVNVPLKALLHNGAEVLSNTAHETTVATTTDTSNFIIATLAKPGCDINLPTESARGVQNQGQNFFVFPAHGNAWGAGHSGAGLSIGRNGVVALEHWHNNIAPVLVWRAPAPIKAPTHVALVYVNNLPALYINGVKVHTGLDSGQITHLTKNPAGTFNGAFSNHLESNRNMDDAAVALLAKEALNSGLTTAISTWPQAWFDINGKLNLAASASGTYLAQMSDGTNYKWAFPTMPVRLTLDADWSVHFQTPYSATHKEVFQTLCDWRDHQNPAVKYFSGTAIYATTFEWGTLDKNQRVLLDLGTVHEIASVTLNDKELGILWKKPFKIDLTSALQTGNNQLVVKVANTWHNRFVGDEQLPDDTGADANGNVAVWPEWLLRNQPRPEPGRQTLVNRKQAKRDSPLQPSGLLGPVTLSSVLLLSN